MRLIAKLACYWLAVILIIQAATTIQLVASEAIYLKNVVCAPYIDHVATDPGLYRYEPFYVKMHRCHGKHPAPNPQNEKCVPRLEGGAVNVSIYVYDQLSNLKILDVLNHTACVQKCSLTQENCSPYEHFRPSLCGCSCNYTLANGRSNCAAPFVWHQSSCNCVCPIDAGKVVCKQRQVFNTEECGCTCKAKFYARCAKRKQIVDEETCYCIEPSTIVGKSRSGCDGGVNGAMLAVVILVEAFVIVFCYYLFYVYCYKHNYLKHKKDKQNVSAGYYHNGDIPNDTVNNVGKHDTYGSSLDDRYSLTGATATAISDKELIRKEERDRRRKNDTRHRHNGYSASVDKERLHREEEEGEEVGSQHGYYPDEEKSPLDPHPHTNPHNNHHHPSELYYDIMEVDGPPSSLDNDNVEIPPDYSDVISDLSEEGYGSVTQV